MIIGRSPAPLNSPGKKPGVRRLRRSPWGDDNSRGKVQNVCGDSSVSGRGIAAYPYRLERQKVPVFRWIQGSSVGKDFIDFCDRIVVTLV